MEDAGTITHDQAALRRKLIYDQYDQIMKKAKNMGIDDAAIKVAGLDASAYNKYKDSKKEVDTTSKEMDRKAKEMIDILTVHEGDTDFLSKYATGKLYTESEMAAVSAEEKKAMKEKNQDLLSLKSKNNEITELAKGFRDKTSNFADSGMAVDKNDRSGLAMSMNLAVNDLTNAAKNGQIGDLESALRDLTRATDESKKMDSEITKKLGDAVGKVSAMIDAIKQRDSKNDKK